AGGLAPGASLNCTATYSIEQGDLDSGSVTNHAKAHANGVDSNEDTQTVNAVQSPALTLTKADDASGFHAPPKAGDKIHYTFTITGNVTLTSVDLTDALVGFSSATCGTTTLAPGADTTCSADYTLTQGDVNSGNVHNAAEACGTPPVGADACDSASTDTPIT